MDALQTAVMGALRRTVFVNDCQGTYRTAHLVRVNHDQMIKSDGGIEEIWFTVRRDYARFRIVQHSNVS